MFLQKLFPLFFVSKPPRATITVDYRRTPQQPAIGIRVSSHTTYGENLRHVILEDLMLVEIPFGVSGTEFTEKHPELHYADARLLEEILAHVIHATQGDEEFNLVDAQNELLCIMHDTMGHVYFFGTLFTDNCGNEFVSMLNTDPSRYAFRYLERFDCELSPPVHNIMLHNYAAVLASD